MLISVFSLVLLSLNCLWCLNHVGGKHHPYSWVHPGGFPYFLWATGFSFSLFHHLLVCAIEEFSSHPHCMGHWIPAQAHVLFWGTMSFQSQSPRCWLNSYFVSKPYPTWDAWPSSVSLSHLPVLNGYSWLNVLWQLCGVCWPLCYPIIMTTAFCVHLTITSWLSAFTITMNRYISSPKLPSMEIIFWTILSVMYLPSSNCPAWTCLWLKW